MPLDPINIGTAPNDGSGDKLRAAFDKINQNDQYLDGKASTAQQTAEAAGTAAQQAQETADEAGLAAEQANTDLAAHKESGDHDDRYLKLDQVVTAPAAGKTPQAGEAGTFAPEWIEGLVNELKYLRSVAENVDWSSPMPLWADGADGFWWDFSDFSTMYQDSTGTTPVTGAGQPVGLVLDKHLGLALGPEENPNVGFDTNLSGWSSGPNASAVWDDGEALVTLNGRQSGSANNWFRLDVPSSAGSVWEISFDATYVSGGDLSAGVAYTTGVVVTAAENGGVKKRYSFRVTRVDFNSRSVVFAGALDITAVWRIDNVSAKQVPGHHLHQPTSTARSVLQQDALGKYYLKPDAIDDFYNITGPIDLSLSTIGVAMVAGSSQSSGLLTSGTGKTGYINLAPGLGWQGGDMWLPRVARQSAIAQVNAAAGTMEMVDSAGRTAISRRSSGASGVSAVSTFLAYPSTVYYSDARIYGAIARVGTTSISERRQVLRYLDSLLGEVTK